MNLLLLVVGLLIVLVANIDALWTTVSNQGGAGPITSRVTSGLWHFLQALSSSKRSRLLNLSGPLILISTLIFWLVLLWMGWTIIFSADMGAVLRARDLSPAGLIDRIYFVGYMLFTAGNGDFFPQDNLWQVAAVLINANGILMISLTVTYVLAVVSAVAKKRALAEEINGLGHRAEEIVMTQWNGQDFSSLGIHLVSVTSQLSLVAQQHLAYPVLHYYHSSFPGRSAAASIAIFDEALTIWEYGIAENYRPNTAVLLPARRAVNQYLDTLTTIFVDPSEHVPPPPDLSHLRAADVPTVDSEQFVASVGELDKHRQLLLGMVSSDARDWPPSKRET